MWLTSKGLKASLFAGAVVAPSLFWAPVAAAQVEGGQAASPLEEAVVTARRREEQPLETPVVVTAFSGRQLQKQGVSNVPDIARLTPQLTIEPNLGSYGGAITLRGVTSPTSNVSSDPAVTINVDGIPLSTGASIRLGQFDLGQVEVLKGPQALFFGKNSSGGILAIRSAEPRSVFESQVDIGYETVGREFAVEAMASGPITLDLLGRVAVRWSNQDGGPFINDAPGVRERREPGNDERGIRGTLVFQTNDDLKIKLIGMYDKLETDGTHGIIQRIYCPSGIPSGPTIPGFTNCKADRHFSRADMLSNIEALTGNKTFRDGRSYGEFEQNLLVLDVTYALSRGLTLSSISGYYHLDQAYADQAYHGPLPLLNFAEANKKKTVSQEFRLSSDASERFNWMVGTFLQDDQFDSYEQLVFNFPALSVRTPNLVHLDSATYSFFGQASFNLTDQLILSGGARYTKEEKRQNSVTSAKFIPKVDFEDTSPEVTLSYRPNDQTNIFASYKRGYKSGGFQLSSSAFAAAIANPAVTTIDNSYKKETVEGFEGGVKIALFDGRLRIDTAIYRYVYDDLQLSNFDPVIVTNRISNASSSLVRGIELNANYAPPIEGLRLRGSVAYNKATYRDFQSACYIGQTIAGGCTIDGPDANTTPDLQDMSGRPLPRAPKWAGSFGVQYDTEVSASLRLELGLDANYQSEAFVAQEDAPWGVRPSKVLWDARVALSADDRAWELAVIGKNLTNEFYPVSGFQEAFTGNAATTGTAVGQVADYAGVVRRGREIWLRLTVRPNLF